MSELLGTLHGEEGCGKSGLPEMRNGVANRLARRRHGQDPRTRLEQGEEVRQIRFAAGILLLVSLCSCISHHINIPEEDLEVDPDWELLVDETIGNNRLLVNSYGGPALLVKYLCIRGSGLYVRIINGTAKKTVFTYNQSEIEGDLIIDYSDAESGVFRFTDFTYDPREDD